jgi:hypothetical protein
MGHALPLSGAVFSTFHAPDSCCAAMIEHVKDIVQPKDDDARLALIVILCTAQHASV